MPNKAAAMWLELLPAASVSPCPLLSFFHAVSIWLSFYTLLIPIWTWEARAGRQSGWPLKTWWHGERTQSRAVTDRDRDRKRREVERQWMKTEAFSGGEKGGKRKRCFCKYKMAKRGRKRIERPKKTKGKEWHRVQKEWKCDLKRLLSGSETLFGCLLAVTQRLGSLGEERLVLIGVIHLSISLTGGP